jgi:hypothetical protein
MSPPRANDSREPLNLFGWKLPAWFLVEVMTTLRQWGLWGFIVVCFCFIGIYGGVNYGGAIASGWSERTRAEADANPATTDALRANQADHQQIMVELSTEIKRLRARLDAVEQ